MSEQDSLTRRERRRQAAGGTDPNDPSAIKDRNQKLRAEVEGKRKDKEKERHQRVAEGLAASEVVDDAIARSADATGKFVRSNFAWMQWIIIVGVAGAMGILIYDYRGKRNAEKAGDAFGTAVVTEYGRVAAADTEKPTDPNLVDTRPEFSTAEARRSAAVKEYEKLVASSDPRLVLLGKMGRAGSLYDDAKYEEAEKAYRAAIEGASEFPEIKARGIEGIFLSQEARKDYEKALSTLDELGKVDVAEAKKLARFHRARVLFQKGDRDGAKKLLVELRDELKKSAPKSDNPMDFLSGPKTYLARSVQDLLKIVDPSAVEKNDLAAQLEALKRMGASVSSGAAPAPPSLPTTPSPAAPSPAPPAPGPIDPWAPGEENQ